MYLDGVPQEAGMRAIQIKKCPRMHIPGHKNYLSVESVELVESVESVESVEPVQPFQPVEPFQPFQPVYLITISLFTSYGLPFTFN